MYLEIKQKQLKPGIKIGAQLNKMEFVDILITGKQKKVYGLWVRKSNNDKYINAAKYAEKQADAKKKYNKNFFDKKTTKILLLSTSMAFLKTKDTTLTILNGTLLLVQWN